MSVNESFMERQLAKQIENSQNEYQSLLYTVSHDLSAPIRSIVAFSRLLQQTALEKLDEKERHYLSFVMTNGEKLQNMFAGLLEHSRLVTRAGEHVLNDTNAVVRRCLVEMGRQIKECSAIIQVDKLPNIVADPMQVGRVFSALIDNAIKFRHKNTYPHITISADKYKKGWRFCVQDNGIGLAEKFSDDIFKIFRHVILVLPRAVLLAFPKSPGINIIACEFYLQFLT